MIDPLPPLAQPLASVGLLLFGLVAYSASVIGHNWIGGLLLVLGAPAWARVLVVIYRSMPTR